MPITTKDEADPDLGLGQDHDHDLKKGMKMIIDHLLKRKDEVEWTGRVQRVTITNIQTSITIIIGEEAATKITTKIDGLKRVIITDSKLEIGTRRLIGNNIIKMRIDNIMDIIGKNIRQIINRWFPSRDTSLLTEQQKPKTVIREGQR